MKEVLVTVFSDNKDSKVLEVLKNYKELLKDLNVCTQHYIYKKGLFIDIPKDSFKNIVFVEVSKDTDHNAKSNFTTCVIHGFTYWLYTLENNPNLYNCK